MERNRRIIDDIAKVAGGALSTLAGVRDELEALVRQQIERMAGQLDLVPRDEFEVVKAMAAKARLEQEALEKRLTLLEARLAETPKEAAAPAKAKAKRGRPAADADVP